MRHFGLNLDDHTYNEFYRLYPDQGLRTALLRKCVKRLIQKGREAGGVLPDDIEKIADKIYQEMERENNQNGTSGN